MARRKLNHLQLNPYQCTLLEQGLRTTCISKEEVDPPLEITMEYMGAVRTMVMDKATCLHNLTKHQVGANQFQATVAIEAGCQSGGSFGG